MTFETSQLQSLNVISGNNSTMKPINLPGGQRHTIEIKNTESGIVAEWVSLLDAQDIH